MMFGTPVSFAEAVRHLASKGLLPTSLDSAGIRQLAAGLRRQSVLSAETLSKGYLGKVREVVGSIINPKQVLRPGETRTVTEGYNPASARVALKDFLAGDGYQAAPGTEGTIKDLSSSKRIDLVVETNVALAHGAGAHVKMNSDAEEVDMWPACEFLRAGQRKEPRNWDGMNGLWENACRRAGDMRALRVFGETGRMCALKSSGVWEELSDSDYTSGGLDQPFDPVAFGTGMRRLEMDRAEAEAVGLLAEGEKAEPAPLDLASFFGEAA